MKREKLLKRLIALVLIIVMTLSFAGCQQSQEVQDPQENGQETEEGIYTPGTYTGVGKGINGNVAVSVTVDANNIVEITVTEHNETPGISDAAIDEVPKKIIETQSVDVDGVSGATMTSDAIKEAVQSALNQAMGIDEGTETDEVEMAFTEPDVIVVGAGFAGVNAAIEAADLGAKVMLFEQNSIIGGSINYAGGTLSGAGTKMQKDAGVEDTPELFYEDIKRLGGDIFIPELTRKHVEKSAEAVDWIDSLGADFGDRLPKQPATYESFGIPREHRVERGTVYLETVRPLLEKHVEDGNVVLLLETQVVDIIIEDGAVTGVVAKTKDGKEAEYKAKATILATGGYGHNEEWINRYNFKNVLTSAPAHASGSGYEFAEKAGAVFSNMEYLPAYPGGVPVSDTGFIQSVTAKTSKYPGVIWVNLDGKRMIDEIDSTPGPIQNTWATAPENIVYIVFDETVRQENEPILTVSSKLDEGWTRFEEEIEKGEVIFKADTIEELAELAGINPEALKETVEEYNSYVDLGEDKEFGRTSSLQKIENGPYYAVKTVPYVLLTKGGPLMNDKAQILNADGEPIPGLYQCGELIGGANIGGAASIGGLANTICVVWGKIAAQSAVEFSLK
ncbi:MAG TPA: FAD-dependent oxidoreductase [Tissierellia bacterium]|nr:FAD-dependent oxidoreductase [Tissierellia bacterium]